MLPGEAKDPIKAGDCTCPLQVAVCWEDTRGQETTGGRLAGSPRIVQQATQQSEAPCAHWTDEAGTDQ